MNKLKLMIPAILAFPLISIAAEKPTFQVIFGEQDVKFVQGAIEPELPVDPEPEVPEEPEEDLTASSCKGLLDKTPTLSNGIHNITYNGGEIPVYCDMSGGGWTLAGTGLSKSTAGWSNPNGVGSSPSISSTYRLPDAIINSIPKTVYKTIALGSAYSGIRYLSGNCSYSSTTMATGVCLSTYADEGLTSGFRQGVARAEVGGLSDWILSANSVIISTQYFGSIASHGWGAGNGNPGQAGTGTAGTTSTIQIWLK